MELNVKSMMASDLGPSRDVVGRPVLACIFIAHADGLARRYRIAKPGLRSGWVHDRSKEVT